MSKALEAAPLRDKLLLAISEVHSGCGAEGERIVDAVLSVIAQLAEDEEVVDAMAKTVFENVGLAAQVHWSDQHVVEGRKDIWRSGIKRALRALAGKE